MNSGELEAGGDNSSFQRAVNNFQGEWADCVKNLLEEAGRNDVGGAGSRF